VRGVMLDGAIVSIVRRIDILFVNAGIARIAPLAATDEAHFDELFRVNVRGPYFLLKHAVAVMPDGGSIILTSSMGAVMGLPGMSAYSATKAAQRSLGLTLAAELAARRMECDFSVLVGTSLFICSRRCWLESSVQVRW
jgi:NAD(P)-dependent dehydrogenase (short-subunit alcohol dehydrogenase family)